MSFVRFPIMDLKELLTIVRESSVTDSERLLDWIYEKATGNNLRYRGILSKLIKVFRLQIHFWLKNPFL